MKKKTATVLFLFCFIALSAKTDVTLYDKSKFPSRHNSGIPIVNSDGDDVNLKCDSTLYNVDVVIKDQYGNVMHQSTQTIGPSETTIYVPSTDGDSEKTTIDLYYDRRHLSGYFEE